MSHSTPSLHPADLLDLDATERQILLSLLRRKRISRTEALRVFDPTQDVEAALERLVQRGWLEKSQARGETQYQVRLGKTSVHTLGDTDLKRKVGLRSLYTSLDLPEETEAAPARPAHLKAGTMLFYMVMLAIVNSLVLGILDVVAVSGFVENLKTPNLPWLWSIEMAVGLLLSGFYLPSIDRIPRKRLINWLLGGLAVLYVIFGGLFMLGVTTRITFPLLYLIYSQQAIIFPMAFWNLANEVYSMVNARRIFPWLASGEMIGRLIGYALFSLPGLIGLTQFESFLANSPSLLLVASAGLFVLGLTHGLLLFRGAYATPKPSTDAPAKSLRVSFTEALETVREVPLFRYLTITSTLEWTALIILWFLFYEALDAQSTANGSFALGYSLFNIAYLIVPLLMQWKLTGYLLKIVAPSNVPLGLPVVIIISVLIGLFVRNAAGIVTAIFLPMVAYNAWDLPALQAIQDLVPEERRGRVRALLNNYSYALGIILGSFLLGGMLFFNNALSSAPELFRLLALMLALIAALGAVTSALWARATYEESLLSWRLTRRQRTSDVLEKLDL